MSKDDRDGASDAAASAETRVLDPDQSPRAEALEAERAATAETRVLDEEAATAETVLAEDGAASAGSDVTGDGDRTLLVSPASTEPRTDSDETVVTERGPESKEADAPLAETRVLDPTQGSPATAAGAAAASLAETRVLAEADKTAPPPVDEPMDDRAGASSAQAPASTPIDSERGLPPGMILFGEYEIVNVLGVGGMGEVYRAKHRRLEEHRAIKVMHAELATKKGASEFFYREAKALLAVRHPAVVHCHDLLSDEEGRVYLIMEMIEGIPLSKKMNDGPLSSDEVAILGARVAHGLTAAHRKGVIHRDLSPDNIVLPNGRVQEAKIIDFGIAKLLEDGEGTILDGFKGKLSYASPEQLGFFGGKIDGRSDFYSLGLVLVAAALGRPMGMGTTVVEAVDARRSFRKLPDAIPIGLRSAIQPLLALDPKDRPEYVDRLFVGPGGIDSFAEAGIPQSLASSPQGTRPRTSGPTSSKSVGLYAGVAAAAALLLGGGTYLAMSEGGSGTPGAGTSVEGVESAPGPGSNPTAASASEPGSPAAPLAAVSDPTILAEAEKPAEMAKAPVKRRLSASDRIKIIGLISNAKLALSENRLMSPANDNAYDRYRRVLELDPADERAQQGLRDIASRYVLLAGQALDRAERDQARTFVDRAKRADPNHPDIAGVEARISR